MKRNVVLLSAVFFMVVGLAQVASSQKAKPASVAGTWKVTARMPAGNQTETWMLKLSGDKVTGMAKGGSTGEAKIDGTFDNVGFLRVDEVAGSDTYKVRATIDGDSLDGSITTGVGKEYLWQAERMK